MRAGSFPWRGAVRRRCRRPVPRLRADSTKGAPGCQAVLGPIRVDLLEATAGGAWERGDRRRRVQRRRGKIDQQTASVARVPDPRIRPGEYDLLIAIGLDAHDGRKVAVPDQGVRAERITSQHRQQSHGLDRHAEARSPVQPRIRTCQEQDRDIR